MPSLLERITGFRKQIDELETELAQQPVGNPPQEIVIKQEPVRSELNVTVQGQQQQEAPQAQEVAVAEEAPVAEENRQPMISPAAMPTTSTAGQSAIKSRLEYWEGADDNKIREGLKDGSIEKFIMEYQGIPLTGMHNIKDSLQKVAR